MISEVLSGVKLSRKSTRREEASFNSSTTLDPTSRVIPSKHCQLKLV